MIVVTVARKPLSRSVAVNITEHHAGALNIGATRIATADDLNGGAYSSDAGERHDGAENWRYKRGEHGNAGDFHQPAGRWPANLLLQHKAECRQVGTRQMKSGVAGASARGFRTEYVGGDQRGGTALAAATFNGPDGMEMVASWECAPGCPVADLDVQSGERPAGAHPARRAGMGYGAELRAQGTEGVRHTLDKGGASRFFKQVGGRR